jgi:hypothetical protein
MSIIKSAKLGSLKNNREKTLREQIVDRYQRVNEIRDDKGNIIQEGENWLMGINEPNVKSNVAILFENQAHHFLNEATDTDSSGSFQVVAFPMIRRIFSKLLSNDIVSVQAMTQPSGSLFFFYPNISERVFDSETGVSSHTSPFDRNLASCVGANCDPTTFSNLKSLYDRFYDDGLFDFSKGKFTIITATGSPVVIGSDGAFTPTSSVTVAADGSVRNVVYGVVGFDGSNPGTSTGHNARLRGGKGLEIDSEEFLASFTVTNIGDPLLDPDGNVVIPTGGEVLWRPVTQRYGKSIVEYSDLCDANGTFVIELDLTHPVVSPSSSTQTYDGYIGVATGDIASTLTSQFAFSWRRYDDLEYETEMGEVTFELKKVDVSVTPRKLRARWSPELAQDVNAYHNIDADAELTALLSEQIGMENDRETLLDLKKGAAWKRRWDYLGWRNSNVGSQKYTQKEWNQTLVTTINQISAQIHKSTLRGGANFIVVSSEASALFDDLENFMVSNAAPAEDKYNLGMRRMGTLSGRYTVYVDPYAKAGDVLIGHKGSSILDTGYIFAPYIAAQLTPTLTDPNNFTSVKGIMTRNARKMVNNRYYGKITIDRIPTFDTRELR